MSIRISPRAVLHRVAQALFYRQGANVFSALQVADFRHLWTGQMISFLGDALAYNTMTLGIIRMAKAEDVPAGHILSALFVLSALPSLFLGMVAGAIVDHTDRKRLMIVADVVRGFLVLGFLLVQDLEHVWIYVAISTLLSAVSVFFYPARTAILPLMLDADRLLAANALAQLTHTLSFVVGAALAGVLVGKFDATAPAFLLDSLSFFLSAAFIARISISGRVPQAPLAANATRARSTLRRWARMLHTQIRRLVTDLRFSVHFVFTDQVMRGVLLSSLALMAGLGAANVTFVPLLIEELGMPEEGLGAIRFAQTLGIITSSALVTTAAVRKRSPSVIIGGSTVAFGLMTVVVSVTANYWLMLAVLFAVGLTISPSSIVSSTLIQRHVPSEKLGRASGARGTIVNVANIASMGVAGPLMDRIGARHVFTLAGVIIAGAGVVAWWVLRDVPHTPKATRASAAESPATKAAPPPHKNKAA